MLEEQLYLSVQTDQLNPNNRNSMDLFKIVVQFAGFHTLHTKYFTAKNGLRLCS
jgi:hypothetical protein